MDLFYDFSLKVKAWFLLYFGPYCKFYQGAVWGTPAPLLIFTHLQLGPQAQVKILLGWEYVWEIFEQCFWIFWVTDPFENLIRPVTPNSPCPNAYVCVCTPVHTHTHTQYLGV